MRIALSEQPIASIRPTASQDERYPDGPSELFYRFSFMTERNEIHIDVFAGQCFLEPTIYYFERVFLWAVVAPKSGKVAAKSELAQSFQVHDQHA